MLERTRARRQALQMLYQREMTGDDVARILAEGSYNDEDGEPSDYSRLLALQTEEHLDQIDAEIEGTSENWSLIRMPFVDRNILRLAVYEIVFEADIPDSVAINEAIEMAKLYGGEDSSKFVNGVLGRIAERHAVDDVVADAAPEDKGAE
ncbi:MAG: transcription antitermination factor NusB [Coriobacteriia bacterium]|nr:transcription antitermination factor NusB [Coriobacteriia bacterium]